jgi:hypothetical protein
MSDASMCLYPSAVSLIADIILFTVTLVSPSILGN